MPSPREYLDYRWSESETHDTPPNRRSERGHYLAAVTQLDLSVVVRRWMRGNRYTQSDVAEELGWPRERLNRMLNGSSWMDLPAMHDLLDIVGLSIKELYPPESKGRATYIREWLIEHARELEVDAMVEKNQRHRRL